MVVLLIGTSTNHEQRKIDPEHLDSEFRMAALDIMTQPGYIPSRSSSSGSESSFTVTNWGTDEEDTSFLSSAIVATEERFKRLLWYSQTIVGGEGGIII